MPSRRDDPLINIHARYTRRTLNGMPVLISAALERGRVQITPNGSIVMHPEDFVELVSVEQTTSLAPVISFSSKEFEETAQSIADAFAELGVATFGGSLTATTTCRCDDETASSPTRGRPTRAIRVREDDDDAIK